METFIDLQAPFSVLLNFAFSPSPPGNGFLSLILLKGKKYKYAFTVKPLASGRNKDISFRNKG